MPVHILFAAAVLSAQIAAAQAPAQSPPQTPATSAEDGPPPAALFTSRPPVPADLGRYEAAIRTAAAAADSLMGPLDGGWRLTDPRGRALYGFQIADRGLGPPTIEGAWRDLRRRSPGSHCGYLSAIMRHGDALAISFEAAGAKDPATATLRRAGGVWRGEFQSGRRIVRVTLTRAGS